MDLPKKDDLDIEGFKERWQLTPEQIAKTKHTEEELQCMQDFLLSVEDEIREEITDWDLEDTYFLYQDKQYEENEGDCILRMFQFSKGLTKCWLVIGCPQIELTSENIDIQLLVNITNILLAELIDVFVPE